MADPDKKFQDALNQINAVQLPDTEKMKLYLQTLVLQGVITPEQAQAALLDKNAFNEIATNPAYTAAQEKALGQLQQIGEEGGLTALDRAKIQDIQDELNTTERGRQEALMQNARERGVGGSGLEMASRLASEQSAADRASRQGIDVAALAQQRALEAIQGAGQLGGQVREQQFGEQAQKATAQNAIDAANANVLNQFAVFNAQQRAAADAANLEAKQRVADENVNIKNTEQAANKNLYQQRFEDQMQKANAAAGVYSAWGQSDAAKNAQKKASTAGMLGTGLQAAGTIGPLMLPKKPATPPVTAAHGGVLKGASCADGGPVMIPGEAKVPGDDEMNDVVDAKLSPGEVVIPRTMANDPDAAADFIRSLRRQPVNVSPEDVALVLKALATLEGGMQ